MFQEPNHIDNAENWLRELVWHECDSLFNLMHTYNDGLCVYPCDIFQLQRDHSSFRPEPDHET